MLDQNRLLISSRDNPKIKEVVRLSKPKERTQTGLFVVEGAKEVNMALSNQFIPQYLCIREGSLIDYTSLHGLDTHTTPIYVVKDKVFDAITYRGQTSEVLAVMRQKNHDFSFFSPSKKELLLIVESMEKPGNVGAAMRVADACGADGLIVCNPTSDIYNPNTIRSSVGTFFAIPIVVASSEDTIKWLSDHHIQPFTTFITQSLEYYKADFSAPCAIVIGSEAYGLSDQWKIPQAQNICITMRGQNDSLNASNALAVIAFEARKQKQLQHL
jgi:RNA methyltransferase, TrmH family